MAIVLPFLLWLASLLWVVIDSSRLLSSGRVTKKELGGLTPGGFAALVTMTSFLGFISSFFFFVLGAVLSPIFRFRALHLAAHRPDSEEASHTYHPPLGTSGESKYQKPIKGPAEVALIVLGSLCLLGVSFIVFMGSLLSHG